MGLTVLSVGVANPRSPSRSVPVECIVDTGATYSLIQGTILRRLGIRPDDEIKLSLADMTTITRRTGQALFTTAGKSRVSTVIFGARGDENLLGVVTLEEMALFLDPLQRKLKPLKMMLA